VADAGGGPGSIGANGIVGDAVETRSRRLCAATGPIEFVQLRHEEYGALALSAERISPAFLWRCVERLGTCAVHLFHGPEDAGRRRSGVAIACLYESSLRIRSHSKSLTAYKFLRYGVVCTRHAWYPEAARSVITTAIRTAIAEKGPTVSRYPGDVASFGGRGSTSWLTIAGRPLLRPAEADFSELVS